MLFFLTLLVYTVPHIMVFGAVNEMKDRVRLPSSAVQCLYNLEKRLNIVNEIAIEYQN